YATANIPMFRNATIGISRRGWIEDFQAPYYHLHVPRHLRVPPEVNQYLQNEGWDKVRLLGDEEELHSTHTADDPMATDTQLEATPQSWDPGSTCRPGQAQARPRLRRSLRRSSPACAESPRISPSGPYNSARRRATIPPRALGGSIPLMA